MTPHYSEEWLADYRARHTARMEQSDLSLDEPPQPKISKAERRRRGYIASEAKNQAAVIERLILHPEVVEIWRVNVGAMMDEHGNFVRFCRAYVRLASPGLAGRLVKFRSLNLFEIHRGLPDLLVFLRSGVTIRMECKREDEKPDPRQRAYLNRHPQFSVWVTSSDQAWAAVDRIAGAA